MFYKLDEDDVLLFGKVVTTQNFELTLETKDNFQYPQDGWHWFESEEKAKAVLNALKAQIPADQLNALVADALVKVNAQTPA